LRRRTASSFFRSHSDKKMLAIAPTCLTHEDSKIIGMARASDGGERHIMIAYNWPKKIAITIGASKLSKPSSRAWTNFSGRRHDMKWNDTVLSAVLRAGTVRWRDEWLKQSRIRTAMLGATSLEQFLGVAQCSPAGWPENDAQAVRRF